MHTRGPPRCTAPPPPAEADTSHTCHTGHVHSVRRCCHNNRCHRIHWSSYAAREEGVAATTPALPGVPPSIMPSPSCCVPPSLHKTTAYLRPYGRSPHNNSSLVVAARATAWWVRMAAAATPHAAQQQAAQRAGKAGRPRTAPPPCAAAAASSSPFSALFCAASAARCPGWTAAVHTSLESQLWNLSPPSLREHRRLHYTTLHAKNGCETATTGLPSIRPCHPKISIACCTGINS